MKSTWLSIFLLTAISSLAQNHTQIKLDTDNEERIFASRLSNILPRTELLAGTDFELGYIVYQSGKKSELFSWNYNAFFHRMVYIAQADTFFLKNDKYIQTIVTDKSQYYFSSKWGVIKTLPGDAPMKLGKQQNLKILRRTELTAHENPAPIKTDHSFSVIYRPVSYMLPREHVYISRITRFFLIDGTGTIRLANRVGFRNAFPGKKNEIDQFIRARYAAKDPLKFTDEADVRELWELCQRK